MNRLFHGDNIDVLRSIDSDSIDLVYLDPPFKSNQDFNIYHREVNGSGAAAQEMAFSDTWKWDARAAKSYRQLIEHAGPVADMMEAFRRVLDAAHDRREQARSEMLAYLSMMAPRLIELRRVLKPTGSLYLHCDPTAAHYLKLLLDAIFGTDRFVNEIVWKRQTAHSDAAQGSKHYGRLHDVLLFYSKAATYTWQQLYRPYDDEYVEKFYNHVEPETGRRFTLSDITAPGGASPRKRNPFYEFLGVKRYWRFSEDRMRAMYAEGRIVQSRPGAVPRQKRYLDEMKGMPIGSVWDDIKPVQAHAVERQGYPTQKPEGLLTRILDASSKEHDVVLDPFCGCGTTVVVADQRHRRWIGIDITHRAIDVIVKRLAERGVLEGKDYKIDSRFAPRTLPDVEAMARKDKHTFQGWALQQAGIEPFQLKPGPDRGIDARKTFFDPAGSHERREIIVSVKGGKLPAGCVRDLIGTVQRERAQIGVLITLRPATPRMIRDATEAPPYRAADGRIYAGIQILTVEALLDGYGLDYPLQLVAHQPATLPSVQSAPRASRTAIEFELKPTTARHAAKQLAIELSMAKAGLPMAAKARRRKK